jgi:selenocysteine lyase/cysteine desulfurase
VKRQLVEKHRVVVKMTGRARFPDEWPAGSPEQAIRLTSHVFNSEGDVKQLTDAVAEVMGRALH